MPRFLPSLRTITTVGSVGALVGFVYYKDARASAHEYVILPAVRKLMDAEDAHKFTIDLMRYPFLCPQLPPRWLKQNDPDGKLQVTLFENSYNPKVKPLHMATPVGVAAGLDKNGEAIDSLFNLGFSWVEIGSVTPLPQPGNPQPRMFRLPDDGAIINRYGFNSDGHAEVLARLQIREAKKDAAGEGRSQPGQVLAVNLGKNKTGDEVLDYVKGVKTFGPHADALVVNVSSPNTPGLRDLQSDKKLEKLLTRLVAERDALEGASLPPLLVKIAPDLEEKQIRAMAKAIKASHVDGVIVGNTTVTRPPTLHDKQTAKEVGGLSGKPVKPLELAVLKILRESVGPELTIIGCGGIFNGKDALEFSRSGADAVQTYTGFVYRGPGLPSFICQDVLAGLGDKSWSK